MDDHGRINFPAPDTMNPDQKEVYDQIVSGPRGKIIGPLRAALHNPALADRWQRLGRVLRYETSLPDHLNELAILVTARHWNSDLEWAIHAQAAKQAGLADYISDAIFESASPEFGADTDARNIYEFTQQIVQHGNVDDATYAAVLARFGEVGVVELTALVGYYSMVAMTLNVHRIPLPEGASAELPGQRDTVTALPSSLDQNGEKA